MLKLASCSCNSLSKTIWLARFPQAYFKNVYACSTNQQKEPQDSETDFVYKKYIEDLEKNASDFQSEFGFVRNLSDIRSDNKRRDLKLNRWFQILWMIIASIGIFGCMLVFDPDSAKKFRKTRLTYACHGNLMIKEIFSTHKGILKKFQVIKNYLEAMKRENLRNTKYFLYLLTHIKQILSRTATISDGNPLKYQIRVGLAGGIIEFLSEIHSIISEDCYSEMHEQYVDTYIDIIDLVAQLDLPIVQANSEKEVMKPILFALEKKLLKPEQKLSILKGVQFLQAKLGNRLSEGTLKLMKIKVFIDETDENNKNINEISLESSLANTRKIYESIMAKKINTEFSKIINACS